MDTQSQSQSRLSLFRHLCAPERLADDRDSQGYYEKHQGNASGIGSDECDDGGDDGSVNESEMHDLGLGSEQVAKQTAKQEHMNELHSVRNVVQFDREKDKELALADLLELQREPPID